MSDEVHPEIRKALTAIKAALPEGANDADAAQWAVLTHAHFLTGDAVVMTKDQFAGAMLAYGLHMASVATGERLEVVDLGGGELAIERTGEPVDGATLHSPAVPATMQ